MNKYEGHTPGPWALGTHYLAPYHSDIAEEAELDTQCISMGVGHNFKDVHIDGIEVFGAGERLQANARLIADAPALLRQRDELLAALKEWVEWSDDCDGLFASGRDCDESLHDDEGWRMNVDAARAAIASIEGEEK